MSVIRELDIGEASDILGASNVPLEFAKEFRPQPFVPNEKEWAAKNRRQHIFSGNYTFTGGAAETLYAGNNSEILYITSIFLQGYIFTNPGSQQIFIYIGQSGGNIAVALARVSIQTGGYFSLPLSFAMPIKVDSGLSVFVDSSAGATSFGNAGITGWTEPKEA